MRRRECGPEAGIGAQQAKMYLCVLLYPAHEATCASPRRCSPPPASPRSWTSASRSRFCLSRCCISSAIPRGRNASSRGCGTQCRREAIWRCPTARRTSARSAPRPRSKGTARQRRRSCCAQGNGSPTSSAALSWCRPVWSAAVLAARRRPRREASKIGVRGHRTTAGKVKVTSLSTARALSTAGHQGLSCLPVARTAPALPANRRLYTLRSVSGSGLGRAAKCALG